METRGNVYKLNSNEKTVKFVVLKAATTNMLI